MPSDCPPGNMPMTLDHFPGYPNPEEMGKKMSTAEYNARYAKEKHDTQS